MASNQYHLGKTIQQLRQQASLTQDELSDKAGLAYSTLAKIERGAIKNPSVFTVASLAQALQVSVEELLNIKTPTPKIQTAGESKTKFFYCDINGVLVRFFQRAFTKLSEETGINLDKIETTFWHYNDAANRGEMSLAEFNKAMAQQLKIKSFDWQNLYFETIEPIRPMQEAMVEISKTTKVGLMSNTNEGFIKKLMAEKLIPDIKYDAIIDSFASHAIKPEAKIYQMAEQAAGCSGSDILFVDDSRTNLMAGERFGWRVLWFDDYRPEESVKRVKEALNST